MKKVLSLLCATLFTTMAFAQKPVTITGTIPSLPDGTKVIASDYATGLYVCPFDLDSATPAIPSVASWTCPAGEEITYMRLFTESGVGLSESVANKLLIVGTWNGPRERYIY